MVELTARRAWSTLEPPWRHAMTMAWESYRDGGVAVGAVITDDAGTVLGSGRNQRFAAVGPRGLLAHAEIGALAGVPDDKEFARRIRLYTTLHPCPMCLGAAVVARVGHLAFGANDPTWLGIEHLPQLNDEVRHRWPTIEGPLPGPIGEWLAVLPCLNTNGTLFRAMRRVSPIRAQLARVIAKRLDNHRKPPETPDLALDRVWDLLTEVWRTPPRG
ncbi:nucleoside deaminase [Paractinoplanes globisporus]|uniref:Nucleoside deaminase n=1 Tax=Paractinoplanes globisporus TaxID=113565 RepID=A0ABW6WCF9_9ACTN|nr:nucleoside deaminase [Actinoplanes globisporus]